MVTINYNECNSDCWKLSKHPASFYRLFGILLSYYCGSYNPKEYIVQRLTRYYDTNHYIDWAIHQIEKAISTLLSELKLPNDLISEEIIREENTDKKYNSSTIKLFSVNVCSFFNSIEYDSPSDLFVPYFNVSKDIRILAEQQRMEFICGTYIGTNRGEEATWRFSNNFKKFQLVYQYMVELGDEDDIITSTTRFTTPNSHTITLNTRGNLWKNIKERLDI